MDNKQLTELLAWVGDANAKSPAYIKAGLTQLADTIIADLIEASFPTNMTIAAPIGLSVVTNKGATSRRHFIGGEELGMMRAYVVPRSYKLMLEFTPSYVSDISVIKIPLLYALKLVDGLEIRLLGAENVMRVSEEIYQKVEAKKVKESVSQFGSKYESIGFGSW